MEQKDLKCSTKWTNNQSRCSKRIIQYSNLQELKSKEKRAAVEVSTNVQDEQTTYVKGKEIGRNDPCPCGSGKKYKKCCGKNK